LSAPPSFSPLRLFSTPPPLPLLYTLSLHDALPIFATDLLQKLTAAQNQLRLYMLPRTGLHSFPDRLLHILLIPPLSLPHRPASRSEEHTSELQPRFQLLCHPLLDTKKTPAIIAHSL